MSRKFVLSAVLATTVASAAMLAAPAAEASTSKDPRLTLSKATEVAARLVAQPEVRSAQFDVRLGLTTFESTPPARGDCDRLGRSTVICRVTWRGGVTDAAGSPEWRYEAQGEVLVRARRQRVDAYVVVTPLFRQLL